MNIRLSGLEFRRQMLHVIFGLFLVVMLYLGWFNIYHMIGILVLGVVLSRLCVKYRVPLASYVMDKFERAEFRKRFPGKGPIFFMVGSIIVLLLFPLKIALASMVILSIGDGLSHIFGKLLCKRKYKYLKSVEGTILGMGFSLLGALFFVSFVPALFAVLSSLLLENFKTGVEDNIMIPIVAAVVLSLF